MKNKPATHRNETLNSIKQRLMGQWKDFLHTSNRFASLYKRRPRVQSKVFSVKNVDANRCKSIKPMPFPINLLFYRQYNLSHSFSKADCLRGGVCLRSGSEPPNNAKRWALSRSTKAFKPSRNNTVFLWTPVSVIALAYKSSSILSVRITSFHWHQLKHHCMSYLMPFHVFFIKGARL